MDETMEAITVRTRSTSTDPRPTFAYVDSLENGLVPVKVVGYYVDDWTKRELCQCVITATRGPYKRGETHSFALHHVVSRRTFIRGNHTFVHTLNHDEARKALAQWEVTN